MKLTREQKTEMFIKQVNDIGVINIMMMSMSIRYIAVQLELANGDYRHWKIENGDEDEFEDRLRFVKE